MKSTMNRYKGTGERSRRAGVVSSRVGSRRVLWYAVIRATTSKRAALGTQGTKGSAKLVALVIAKGMVTMNMFSWVPGRPVVAILTVRTSIPTRRDTRRCSLRPWACAAEKCFRSMRLRLDHMLAWSPYSGAGPEAHKGTGWSPIVGMMMVCVITIGDRPGKVKLTIRLFGEAAQAGASVSILQPAALLSLELVTLSSRLKVVLDLAAVMSGSSS
mmetsp:Transcript_78378/g.138481  ORF Transcript_78378/g.138481 Transcript_78378/m.138481 type:complete len:215 (-) Transcript_78378:608-1252(-)